MDATSKRKTLASFAPPTETTFHISACHVTNTDFSCKLIQSPSHRNAISFHASHTRLHIQRLMRSCDPRFNRSAPNSSLHLLLPQLLQRQRQGPKTARFITGLPLSRACGVFDYPDPSGLGLPDLSKNRMRFADWIHAVLSVLVFGAVALRDKNAVSCFYPAPEQGTKKVLDIVPMGVGVICGLLFLVFPARRHGIGYPVTGDGSRR